MFVMSGDYNEPVAFLILFEIYKTPRKAWETSDRLRDLVIVLSK